eukprot:34795-Eustigmatos_ZCMA.PRE.1
MSVCVPRLYRYFAVARAETDGHVWLFDELDHKGYPHVRSSGCGYTVCLCERLGAGVRVGWVGVLEGVA